MPENVILYALLAFLIYLMAVLYICTDTEQHSKNYALDGSEEETENLNIFFKKAEILKIIIFEAKTLSSMRYKALGYMAYLKIYRSELSSLFHNNLGSTGEVDSEVNGLQDVLSFYYIRALKRHPDSIELWVSYSEFLCDTLELPNFAIEKINQLKSRIKRFSLLQKIQIA